MVGPFEEIAFTHRARISSRRFQSTVKPNLILRRQTHFLKGHEPARQLREASRRVVAFACLPIEKYCGVVTSSAR